MAWFNERKRSPNETNLAKTHNMFMSAVLFHSQNACVHCRVYVIRYIRSIRCSTTWHDQLIGLIRRTLAFIVLFGSFVLFVSFVVQLHGMIS